MKMLNEHCDYCKKEIVLRKQVTHCGKCMVQFCKKQCNQMHIREIHPEEIH